MTESSNPGEERAAAPDTETIASVPPVDAPAAPPAPGPIPPFATPYVPPPTYQPFMPVFKEPWINPAKRTTLLVWGIVAALVLLGAGFVIGACTTHDGHGRIVRQGGPVLQGPGYFNFTGPNGKRFRLVPGQNGVFPGVPNPSNLPSTAPSPTHS
jgi:hypothetical protein